MKKIAVGILGATGTVGQKFVDLLSEHPQFEITALAASDRSTGKKYGEAIRLGMVNALPKRFADMEVLPCTPNLPCKIVFSGLDSSVAGEIEEAFAKAGYVVISNARNHRMHPTVPLLIPEVNGDHLNLLKTQKFGKGVIVTNPNCSVIGLTLALKPLLDKWNMQAAHVVTLQALSGAGYPGVPSMDILDNVIPYIDGEEAKVETEPLKILGSFQKDQIIPHPIRLSAQCTRVAVSDGHMACVSIKFNEPVQREEIINAWNNFQGLDLHSAPKKPIHYLENEKHPQPKLHRNLEAGMAVSVGRLRECPLFDWKFIVLSHNTVRGAAGCAILNAELMAKAGYLDIYRS
jgi:aspartate-semialdehyde dehydrogenase